MKVNIFKKKLIAGEIAIIRHNSQSCRGIPLGVQIDHKYFKPFFHKSGPQIYSCGRLSHTTFLINDGYDFRADSAG
ncbi:hypothetical protein P775_06300 [Puniceibacterium antarcticum]|uniref:Uncharacterized protein n=1 Tax=Puniceibacterium antarcticum TaxID=1206336 RepID=A0A2G8RHT1_9RHOB|nr:hypothetical protein P775_06300 [Puniceibacterium antarcticum]